MEKLRGLQNKYKVVGDVRGKGLFCGFELVKDRLTKEPVEEKMLMAVAADCMQQGVVIGRTNRSLTGLNNVVCLSPALICTEGDIDEIVNAIDSAMSRHAIV